LNKNTEEGKRETRERRRKMNAFKSWIEFAL
jgi:hypothetical protein